MPLSKLLSVTLGGIREADHRALAEEEAEHAADVTSANLSSSHSLVQFVKVYDSMCQHSHIPKSGIAKVELHGSHCKHLPTRLFHDCNVCQLSKSLKNPPGGRAP